MAGSQEQQPIGIQPESPETLEQSVEEDVRSGIEEKVLGKATAPDDAEPDAADTEPDTEPPQEPLQQEIARLTQLLDAAREEAAQNTRDRAAQRRLDEAIRNLKIRQTAETKDIFAKLLNHQNEQKSQAVTTEPTKKEFLGATYELYLAAKNDIPAVITTKYNPDAKPAKNEANKVNFTNEASRSFVVTLFDKVIDESPNKVLDYATAKKLEEVTLFLARGEGISLSKNATSKELRNLTAFEKVYLEILKTEPTLAEHIADALRITAEKDLIADTIGAQVQERVLVIKEIKDEQVSQLEKKDKDQKSPKDKLNEVIQSKTRTAELIVQNVKATIISEIPADKLLEMCKKEADFEALKNSPNDLQDRAARIITAHIQYGNAEEYLNRIVGNDILDKETSVTVRTGQLDQDRNEIVETQTASIKERLTQLKLVHESTSRRTKDASEVLVKSINENSALLNFFRTYGAAYSAEGAPELINIIETPQQLSLFLQGHVETYLKTHINEIGEDISFEDIESRASEEAFAELERLATTTFQELFTQLRIGRGQQDPNGAIPGQNPEYIVQQIINKFVTSGKDLSSTENPNSKYRLSQQKVNWKGLGQNTGNVGSEEDLMMGANRTYVNTRVQRIALDEAIYDKLSSKFGQQGDLRTVTGNIIDYDDAARNGITIDKLTQFGEQIRMDAIDRVLADNPFLAEAKRAYVTALKSELSQNNRVLQTIFGARESPNDLDPVQQSAFNILFAQRSLEKEYTPAQLANLRITIKRELRFAAGLTKIDGEFWSNVSETGMGFEKESYILNGETRYRIKSFYGDTLSKDVSVVLTNLNIMFGLYQRFQNPADKNEIPYAYTPRNFSLTERGDDWHYESMSVIRDESQDAMFTGARPEFLRWSEDYVTLEQLMSYEASRMGDRIERGGARLHNYITALRFTGMEKSSLMEKAQAIKAKNLGEDEQAQAYAGLITERFRDNDAAEFDFKATMNALHMQGSPLVRAFINDLTSDTQFLPIDKIASSKSFQAWLDKMELPAYESQDKRMVGPEGHQLTARESAKRKGVEMDAEYARYIKKWRSAVKEKMTVELVYQNILDRSPSAALNMERRKWTPQDERTIRETLLKDYFLSKDKNFAYRFGEQLIEGNFDPSLVSESYLKLYVQGIQLIERNADLKRRNEYRKARAKGTEGDNSAAFYDKFFGKGNKLNFTAQDLASDDKLKQSLRVMYQEFMKSYGIIQPQKSGHTQVDISRLKEEDFINDLPNFFKELQFNVKGEERESEDKNSRIIRKVARTKYGTKYDTIKDPEKKVEIMKNNVEEKSLASRFYRWGKNGWVHYDIGGADLDLNEYHGSQYGGRGDPRQGADMVKMTSKINGNIMALFGETANNFAQKGIRDMDTFKKDFESGPLKLITEIKSLHSQLAEVPSHTITIQIYDLFSKLFQDNAEFRSVGMGNIREKLAYQKHKGVNFMQSKLGPNEFSHKMTVMTPEMLIVGAQEVCAHNNIPMHARNLGLTNELVGYKKKFFGLWGKNVPIYKDKSFEELVTVKAKQYGFFGKEVDQRKQFLFFGKMVEAKSRDVIKHSHGREAPMSFEHFKMAARLDWRTRLVEKWIPTAIGFAGAAVLALLILSWFKEKDKK